jgi:hypothetical protein
VDSPTWPAWQLLAPPAAEELNSLSALPDNPDETIGAAAGAAYTAARYGVSQGYYAAASLRQVTERLVVMQGGTHRSCWASCQQPAIHRRARSRPLEWRIDGTRRSCFQAMW